VVCCFNGSHRNSPAMPCFSGYHAGGQIGLSGAYKPAGDFVICRKSSPVHALGRSWFHARFEGRSLMIAKLDRTHCENTTSRGYSGNDTQLNKML
jgi:hypothetical protein